MNKTSLAILGMLLLLVSPAEAAQRPLQVVASFSILADMVSHIGGDAVTVKSLVGPDMDTHTYEPSPEDAKAIAKADLVFINGLGFEGWVGRLVSASGYHGEVIVASRGVKVREMSEHEGGSSVTVDDPHAWQDLTNGRLYAKNITLALEKALPDQAATIRVRAAKYEAEMKNMDDYVHSQFGSIPLQQRKIITSHDAFGYFGEAYGVKFLAPVGLSTDAEPAAADVAALINQIKEQGVKQLFIENMTNPKLIEQIARDSGAQMGGTLYSDALSAKTGPAPTYLDMFRNNVPKLKAAMQLNAR